MATTRRQETEAVQPSRLRCTSALGLWIGATGAALALVAAEFVRTDPAEASTFESLALFAALLVQAFSFHIGVAIACMAVLALAIRRPRQAGVLVLLAMLPLGPVAWTYVRPSAPVALAREDALVVASFNTFYGDANLDALLAWLDSVDPDVVLLQEYQGGWDAETWAAFEQRWPHIAEQPSSSAWGQALMSRIPFETEPVDNSGGGAWSRPQLVAEILFGGRRLELRNIHLMSPSGGRAVGLQRQQTAWMAGDVAETLARADAPDAVILAGDFNAPFRSNHIREFRELGLLEAHDEQGVGRGASWHPPERRWFWLPGVRIDQAMYSGALRCLAAEVGPDVGSDHRPIVASFAWSSR